MHDLRWIACVTLGLTGCCLPLPLGEDGDERTPAGDGPDDGAATLTPLPPPGSTPGTPGPSPGSSSPGTTGWTAGSGPGVFAPLRAMAGGEVPQVQHRFELFHDAPRLEGAEVVEDGLMLCDIRVSTESDADTFKGPDTSMNLRLGRHAIRTARGPEDSWGAVLSMPVSRLAHGDTVWLRVIDRDVWHDEVIGSDSLTYRGRFPLRFRADHLRVECRALGEGQVEARVGRPLAKASSSLDRLRSRLRPDAREPGFGYPAGERLRVARDLAEAAAWVDWDDARVEALLDRGDRLDATWRRRVAGEVARAAGDLPAVGADVPLGPGYEGSVREVRCGLEADRLLGRHRALHGLVGRSACLARLALRRVDGGAQRFGPSEPVALEMRVLTDDGRSLPATPVARQQGNDLVPMHQPGGVASGETAHLWVALPASPEATGAGGARLLWLRPRGALARRGWLARLR